jgi:predicted N-acetyltransferase YhbS
MRGGSVEEIIYQTRGAVTDEEFVSVLERSTLGERRPVDDAECIRGMLEHADLVVTARVGGKLVGVARSVTDFHYCCYLSDLAVDRAVQRRGIGRSLIEHTRRALGPRCALILLAAPGAVDYYPRIGFTRHESAWIVRAGERLAP